MLVGKKQFAAMPLLGYREIFPNGKPRCAELLIEGSNL